MCERELETEQRLQHTDLPSPSRHSRVSFSFSWTAQPEAWGPSLLVLFSLPHLVSNSSDLQLTDFLSSQSYIIVHSPTQYLPITDHQNLSLLPSLEWHVWSSSSRNNFHAVHRSLSSSASLCDGTVGFLPCPILSAKPAYAISSHNWPLECVTPAVFGMTCLAGSKVNIQHCF